MENDLDNFYNNFTVNVVNDLSNLNLNNNSITILHQNIRSLRKNFDLLVANLSAFPKQPDFIFLSEIWIFSNEVENFSINGYNFYAVPNDNYSAGGVGVFIKSDFNCRSVSCGLSSADAMKVTFALEKDVYTIYCFYRLHSHPVCTFLDELNVLLTREKCKNLLLVGDFNLDLLAYGDEVDSYNNILANNGIFSFLNKPTRPVSGSCIDHILGRFAQLQPVYECFNFNLDITDHFMTGIKLTTFTNSAKNNTIKTFSKVNYKHLNQLLLSENWNDVYNATDISSAYSLFLKKLKNYINMSTFTQPIVSTRNSRIKPWITSSLLNRIKLKNKLKTKSFKHPHNQSLKKRLKKLTKSIKNDIPKARENYYSSKFRNCNGNLKKEWELLNKLQIGIQNLTTILVFI